MTSRPLLPSHVRDCFPTHSVCLVCAHSQLSIEELVRLLKDLMPGLTDPDAEAALGAAEIIK